MGEDGRRPKFYAILVIALVSVLAHFRKGDHAPARMAVHGRAGDVHPACGLSGIDGNPARNNLRVALLQAFPQTIVVEADDLCQRLAKKPVCAATEQFFSRRVRLDYPVVPIEQEDGKDEPGNLGSRIWSGRAFAHAARRCRNGS